MNSPLKVLLFLIGGLATIGAVAYYVDGPGKGSLGNAPMVAALPEDKAAPQADAAPAPSAAVEPAAAEPQVVGNEQVLAPTFDLLRVEPDGSMVIAGRSTPKAGIEVVVGSNVIATATANADREFVVVLDEPLKPGNYQIVLRSTSPDNVVATSLETALVSVPDSPSGEVLALVEEPGKASRLITVPEGEAPAAVAAATDDAAAGTAAALVAEAPATSFEPPAAVAGAPVAGAAAPAAIAEAPAAGEAAAETVAEATPSAPADAPQTADAPAGDTAAPAALAAADAPADDTAAPAVLPEAPAAGTGQTM
ncbi:peptigoglycan-binding protein LysM, partial [Aquibium sp. ELW1220]|uniref:peptigoglycan-binding protein LysM n=1 Tax=Aquibium sp. ELW1220 TaxID=2976766 RepID=UPI0025AF89C7